MRLSPTKVRGMKSDLMKRGVIDYVARWLLEHHDYIAPLMPAAHLPYRFAGGWIFINIKESPMMLARALGYYEVEKAEAIRRFLKPGSAFVDAGANKGDFSLIAAALLKGTGKVLAFEPAPANVKWLQKSVALNRYTNVRVCDVALADGNGTASLYLGEKSGWHTLVPGLPHRNAAVITVGKSTLDGFLEKSQETKVDMLKIDVEGAELQVLEGARHTLDRNKDIVLLIDTHPSLGVSPKTLSDFLVARGFGIYELQRPFDRPASPDDHLEEILAYR